MREVGTMTTRADRRLPGIIMLTMCVSLFGTTHTLTGQEEEAPYPMMNRMLDLGAHVGPVIESSGPVFTVEEPDLAIPAGYVFKAVFEVTDGSASPESLNAAIDNASRFLNMHVEAGVPLEDVQVGVVIHGAATTAVLDNDAYRERFGVDNPNLLLFDALSDAGVRLYVCAQAANAFQVPREQIASQVDVALSAMTALVMLEAEGYQRVF